MKLRLENCFDRKFNEFIVGPKQTASHGTYLVCGEIKAGERRKIAPGKGHEEILLILSGEGTLSGSAGDISMGEEEAVYLAQDFEGELAASEAAGIRYVAAGGHLPGGHGH